jgi:acetyltransferase-like isoleucine patch superfamily enzyme
MTKAILAFLRHARTRLAVMGKRKYLSYGSGLHIGKCSRLWAPDKIVIGKQVYIGKYVHIECNCDIGDYVLMANRVALVGRYDHDFRAVGYPIRFAPWAGDAKSDPALKRKQKIVMESDVWIGFGATILSGIRIGRGALVGAGSVVVHDVPPYAIVAGNPARVIGMRFDASMIEEHEARIKDGIFRFSEKGYAHWTVKPGTAAPEI